MKKIREGLWRFQFPWKSVLKKNENEIWMLTIYGKNEKSTIPGHVLKRITEELKDG